MDEEFGMGRIEFGMRKFCKIWFYFFLVVWIWVKDFVRFYFFYLENKDFNNDNDLMIFLLSL